MGRCSAYRKNEFACLKCPMEKAMLCPEERDTRSDRKPKHDRAYRLEQLREYNKVYNQLPEVKEMRKVKARKFEREKRIAEGKSVVFGKAIINGIETDIYKGRGDSPFYYFIGLDYFESDGRDLVGKWVS